MDTKSEINLLFVAQNASDSHVCKHIYLRGNHKLDMFHDKVDKINVWNRLWLSAAATETEILSAQILDNHLHITVILKSDKQDSVFMHHFRLSITQYYNRRYKLTGMLGTRRFGRAEIKDIDDLKDCICYHLRNVLHHGVLTNFLDYQFSTARFVFGLGGKNQQGFYTHYSIPEDLEMHYYPKSEPLPDSWTATIEGMIVPPHAVFRTDIIESLFNSKKDYLEALSHQTLREISAEDEPCMRASDSRFMQTLDEQVAEFVNKRSEVKLPSMNQGQKMEAIAAVRKEFPKISYQTLERIFGIPASTICYRITKLHGRE